MEKYRVPLAADERNALEKLVAVGRAAARKLTHARMLLLADTSHGLEQRDDPIVLALGPRVCPTFYTRGSSIIWGPCSIKSAMSRERYFIA